MRVGVVVPALDEEATVGDAVGRAHATIPGCDVVVVDGGSADATTALARAAGARVLVHPGTRAEAMNAGAAAVDGEALLFLHADTTLPDGSGEAIARALSAHDGGAFTLEHDARPRAYRVASVATRRLHYGVYGDQAIFVRREAFERLGGYADLPIMEDYDLVQRVRRVGAFVVLPQRVTSSARRQRAQGELRTLARVGSIKLLYRLGVPPAWLAARYRPAR
ncbi:MAG: TIGR04283 family arsenosugar biosynthesis glycosyltransferase [Gaiella sp.]